MWTTCIKVSPFIFKLPRSQVSEQMNEWTGASYSLVTITEWTGASYSLVTITEWTGASYSLVTITEWTLASYSLVTITDIVATKRRQYTRDEY